MDELETLYLAQKEFNDEISSMQDWVRVKEIHLERLDVIITDLEAQKDAAHSSRRFKVSHIKEAATLAYKIGNYEDEELMIEDEIEMMKDKLHQKQQSLQEVNYYIDPESFM